MGKREAIESFEKTSKSSKLSKKDFEGKTQSNSYSKSSIGIIKNFINRLNRDFAVEKIIFFGSRATGKAREDSDIDLIVVSSDFEEMNGFERISKMYDYWTELVPVDFICYTKKEYERLRKRISIVREALKNGILIR